MKKMLQKNKTMICLIGLARENSSSTKSASKWTTRNANIFVAEFPLCLIFKSTQLLKAKALEAAMNDINNSFGKGAVTRLGNAGGSLVDSFPSGCLTLDIALGVGLPRGNIVEDTYGSEMVK
ncbi:hypothetical protein ACET3Z_000264 [Daucus carota]